MYRRFVKISRRYTTLLIACSIVTFGLNYLMPEMNNENVIEMVKTRSVLQKVVSGNKLTKLKNTGNLLIDEYGQNDLTFPGENGIPVPINENERQNVSDVMRKFRINVLASDKIPLNRIVPDSRPKR